ncbi:MAG: histidine phosphatase family protein [Verrucomicrobiia bacterium]|jgi:broad specificity phosphatase PhoE
MENPTKLYLVRHGEVEERYLQIYGGRIDMNLSERGREQAMALGPFFARQGLDAIYCSTMKRARQTLEPIAEHASSSPVFIEDLREIDFGAWTGLSWQEVAKKHESEVADWLHLLDSGEVDGAESTADLRTRVEPCLNRILESHPGQSVAIICHGAVIRQLLSGLLSLPIRELGGIDISYAGVSLIEHDGKRNVARYINNTPWRLES